MADITRTPHSWNMVQPDNDKFLHCRSSVHNTPASLQLATNMVEGGVKSEELGAL